MKTITTLFALLTILLVGCKEPKNETVENTVKAETVVTETPKGSVIATAQLIEAAKLKDLMASDDELQLVDVRTPEEFAEGHLAGAVNINIEGENFNDEIQKLLRDEPVFLYCRSGGRSARAGKVVAALGYRAFDLDKGIQGWEAQEFPVEK